MDSVQKVNADKAYNEVHMLKVNIDKSFKNSDSSVIDSPSCDIFPSLPKQTEHSTKTNITSLCTRNAIIHRNELYTAAP